MLSTWLLYALFALMGVMIAFLVISFPVYLVLNSRVIKLRQQGQFRRAIPLARWMVRLNGPNLWMVRVIQPIMERSTSRGLVPEYVNAVSLLTALHQELGEIDDCEAVLGEALRVLNGLQQASTP